MKSFVVPTGRIWAGLRYRLAEVPWARSLRLRLRAGAYGGGARADSTRSEVERNVRYLYIEIFWAAIFSAVFAFNATYALRLGATNQMVGWLSSLPSLFAMFLMIPAARFLESRDNPSPWMVGSLALGRAGFLMAALVPWLFPKRAAEVIIALFVVRTIPITFFNTAFSPLLADVIPTRDRSRVFANRNIIMSATTAAVTFLAGKWLDAALQLEWAAFPLNYQLLYVIGGSAALISAFFVSKVRAPDRTATRLKPAPKRPQVRLRDLRKVFRAIVTERRDFALITVNTLIFNLGAWLVMPLYTILFVKELGASDGWIGLNSTLANLGVIAGYALWRPWIARLGDNRALRLSVPLAASYAFLVALFPNLTLILVWGILINLINPGVNLAHTNVFYRVCPEERRASYMAIYSSIMNAGAFVCPMIGVALAEVMDIRWVLAIGGIVRLLGGLLFHVWRIEDGEVVS
ncbi:MAG: MFS transporter [Anaerolineae bacterium]